MNEVTNEQIYKLLISMQSDLADVKKRVDGIETRLDRMENKVDSLENKVDTIETKVSTIEKTTNVTQEHVARIDERTTQTEKLTKIFNMKEVDKAIERAAK